MSSESTGIDDVLDNLVDDLQLGLELQPSDEAPEGSVITKKSYVTPDESMHKMLVASLNSQLDEHAGDFVFTVGLAVAEGETSGLTSAELSASVATLTDIAHECDADVTELRSAHGDEGKLVADYLVRRRLPEEDFREVRIAVVGNVDAGKSTLLGVLTHNVLDNGRGLSRQQLFRHKHELETGRTSSVSLDILGFDTHGAIVNKPAHDGKLDWVQICREAHRVTTFIDLAGHERYLKTTVCGLTGADPHYAMLMIGSNAGIVGMTKEHLGLALALHVPVYVVVTKIDMCPPNVLQSTMTLLQKILKSPGCRKIPMVVNNIDDVMVASSNFVSQRVCPIFQVSNVTGDNLDLLKMFINLLKPTQPATDHMSPIFHIDDTFSVPGVGTVVSGNLQQGVVRTNDTLLIGPDSLGNFVPTVIKGIHRRRLPVSAAHGGQTCSFALKKIKRKDIRKGMVLVARDAEPEATWEFEGEILVLHHPTTISASYQAMIHCGAVRQTASILRMDKEFIRTGDKTTAAFRFIKNPEYIQVGQRIVFREGRTKAIGTITKLL
jgi:GTPase